MEEAEEERRGLAAGRESGEWKVHMSGPVSTKRWRCVHNVIGFARTRTSGSWCGGSGFPESFFTHRWRGGSLLASAVSEQQAVQLRAGGFGNVKTFLLRKPLARGCSQSPLHRWPPHCIVELPPTSRAHAIYDCLAWPTPAFLIYHFPTSTANCTPGGRHTCVCHLIGTT